MSHTWNDVDALFTRLLDTPLDQREAALQVARASDPELYETVRGLLDTAEGLGAFLTDPAAVIPSEFWEELGTGGFAHDGGAEDRTGQRIGDYRVVRVLNRGGMGTVYLAEREGREFSQEVAVKVLRRGVDTDDVVAHFRAERQILASLHHPNIGQLIDGGATEDGLPFLVMEYVDGLPIDRYCEAHGCTQAERLGLFIAVSSAVQHAHKSLVVHRDLKPGNVLVTADGTPKLLDFGIAKLLDASAVPATTPATRAGHHLLTPQYASPEQLSGGLITTASDVYQLGILLHELLTGERPAIDPGGGQVRTTTTGELDTVVRMALRRDPERRYASAERFADDVQRFLDGRPVSAAPDRWSYRSRKFMERNRWFAPVSAVLLLFVTGYISTVVRHGRALEVERTLAQAEAARASQVQRFMVDLFRSSDPFDPADADARQDITVRQALDLGTERVREELNGQPAIQAAMLGAISDVYGNLDLFGRAASLRGEALSLELGLYGPVSEAAAVSMRRLAESLAAVDQQDSADALIRRSEAAAREALGPDHPEVAFALMTLALFQSQSGEFEASVQSSAAAIRILRAADPPLPVELSGAIGTMGDSYSGLGDHSAALAAKREMWQIRSDDLGKDDVRTALARIMLAAAQGIVGDVAAAEESFRQALPVVEQLGRDHNQYMSSLNNFAILLGTRERFAEAEALHRELLEIRLAKYGEDHREVAASLQNLAAVLARLEKYDEAEQLLERAYTIYRNVLQPGHYLTAFPLLTRAEIQLERGDFGGAAASSGDAAAILATALPEGHFATAVARCRWGRALSAMGRVGEAEPRLRAGSVALAANGTRPDDLASCQAALGELGS